MHIKKGFYFLLLVLLLATAILFERAAYIKSLLQSERQKMAVSIGNYINSHTEPGEKSLIISPDFKQDNEVFVLYYADRDVSYFQAENGINELLKDNSFRLIVTGESLQTPQQVINDLQYPYTQLENFRVYDLMGSK